eukprot:GHVU01214664.1.p1 GENE.GHVU01214664.1~~GHVU01214664.1.p1  ORF type:complete len:377 (+),score=63.79 GHVU01214664.1:39-1133(+)
MAAASAIGGNAFLIPPEISKADIDTINTLPFDVAAEGMNKIVDLKCKGCPVPAVSLDGKTVALQHVESLLQLNYTIQQNTGDVDSLFLNGVPVYPPSTIEPFTATQKFSKFQPFETQENVRLGYEMSLRPIKNDGDLELISINVHIFEVADKFIDGINSVELRLLKTPTGKLMIASAVEGPSTSSSAIGLIGDKDCTSMVCKWKAIIAAKLAHLKPGCKGKGSKTLAVAGHTEQGPKAGHKGQGRPHPHGGRPHHGHHGGHRHHRGFFRFMHMLRSVALHVLIPVSIGIAAGLTASVVGMVFGQLVIFAWRSIRGSNSAYSPVAQDEILDEENKIFIVESQGPPPVYEDVVLEEEVTQEKEADA